MRTDNCPVNSDYLRNIYFAGYNEGYNESINIGCRQVLRMALSTKQIETSPEIDARITHCADPEQLTQWLVDAITGKPLEEVFAD
ncbi:hypothetical protein ABZ942_31295 [Nocardia sp. NPDC046473]|uniref:hypothetical protein n=1 Tax=Nocardia sp. NPDC046473 TaxID=3155733 RepID=UPI0033E6FA65